MHRDMRMNGAGSGPMMTTTATGFMLGALVGAGVALLLAPAPGEQTRRELRSMVGRAGTAARDGLGSARDGLGRAKDKLGRLTRDAGSALGAGRDAMRDRGSEDGLDTPLES